MSVDRGAPGGPTSLKATAGMRRRGTSAAQLANRLIADLAGGGLAQIPVAIRFWDGSMLAPRNRNDVPVLVANQHRALAHLVHAPSQLGLARAWGSRYVTRSHFATITHSRCGGGSLI